MSYTLRCRFVRETDDAVLVEELDRTQHWFPFSQVERMDKKPDGTGAIVISDWLAAARGLE